MKSQIRTQTNDIIRWQALAFCCPGCAEIHGGDGLHTLPVNSVERLPSWDWDGNLEAPTLSPSILTRSGNESGPTVCHSFLRSGIFEFLTDCTHSLAGQSVPLPDLPDWAMRL